MKPRTNDEIWSAALRMAFPLMTPVSPSISFTVPVHTVSEANSRDGWRAKAKRAKLHRGLARLLAQQHASAWLRQANAIYLVVTMTRVGTRKMDDDNLRSACKGTRDGIADFLGIDDGSDRVEWWYEQRIIRKRKRLPFDTEPKAGAVEVTMTIQATTKSR